jgi:hypothetical protein
MTRDFASLPANVRERRWSDLRLMTPHELVVQNNIANNNATMRQLGLIGAAGIIGATWGRAKKTDSGKNGRKRARRTNSGSRWESSESSSGEDESADSGHEAGEITVGKRKSTRLHKQPAPDDEGNAVVGSTTNWATEGRERLMKSADQMPAIWTKGVDLWFAREEAEGFQSPVSRADCFEVTGLLTDACAAQIPLGEVAPDSGGILGLPSAPRRTSTHPKCRQVRQRGCRMVGEFGAGRAR